MGTPIEPRRATNMPKVWPQAWHGAIGEAVWHIAPSTEADPVAVLASALALFGAMCGDAPHVLVGGQCHPARIWPLIVGKTGAGRKGTSTAEARRFARLWGSYGHNYERMRCIGGLASGEGLIAQLGGTAGKPEEQAEVAAADGRLTVIESEFARVLTSSKRDGSTLGPIMRQLWEDGSAAILTRANPLRVEGAHLGMIAHITPGELRLRLAESDLVGGTLNRFLLIASTRPQLLPHEVERHDLTDAGALLGKMLDRARTDGHVLHRDRAAEELWPRVYHALNQDEPDGQLGAVLARGPAYTMRLALVYALADGAGAIAPEHLLAGLAVWYYASRSARMVFPSVREGSDLEKLFQYLSQHSEGISRTDVSTLFGRNRSVADLDALLRELLERKVATVERDEARSGPGRPAVRYRPTGLTLDPMAQILSEYS